MGSDVSWEEAHQQRQAEAETALREANLANGSSQYSEAVWFA
ncbi:hypothetical protein [Streptomyces sp. NBC_01006]|nr:hypothetical protein OG509_42065 [Streptomyces sp. NBC_01006]